MTIYPWDYTWADWVEPGFPMLGPAFDWSAIRYITIHYPGAPNVLALSVESERAEIRAENRMYWTDPNRGYALGYNAKVFQDGSKWELRGDKLRCAANGNQALNVPGFAIQVRVANTETPSEALIESVRVLVAWAREKAGRDLPINGHRDLKPTACPGDKAYALIQSGAFEPRPALTPVPEEDEMFKVIKNKDAQSGITCSTNGLIKTWLDNGHASAAALRRAGQTVPEDVGQEEFASYGPIVGPVPSGHDAYGRQR